MPRTYERTTDAWSPEAMQNAIRAARRGVAIREVCRRYSVPRSTLRDRIAERGGMEPDEPARLGRNATFSKDSEEELAERMILLSDMYYGITKETLAAVAYQFAERQRLQHRFSHEKKKTRRKRLGRGFPEAQPGRNYEEARAS